MKRIVEVHVENGTHWTFEAQDVSVNTRDVLVVETTDRQTFHFPVARVLWWSERREAA